MERVMAGLLALLEVGKRGDGQVLRGRAPYRITKKAADAEIWLGGCRRIRFVAAADLLQLVSPSGPLQAVPVAVKATA